jgi:amidase
MSLRHAIIAATLAVSGAASAADFSIVEASVGDMQKALKEGRVTSHELVAQSLARIAMYENQLNTTLAVAKDAFRQADEMDRERSVGRIRGPLHGIPVAIKDNINTTATPPTCRPRPARWRSRD